MIFRRVSGLGFVISTLNNAGDRPYPENSGGREIDPCGSWYPSRESPGLSQLPKPSWLLTCQTALPALSAHPLRAPACARPYTCAMPKPPRAPPGAPPRPVVRASPPSHRVAHRVLTTVAAHVAARLRNRRAAAPRGAAWPPLPLRRTDFTPLSRLWPSNSLPARRAHSNAPAAPANCQCYSERRTSEPGRASAARTAPSSSASPAATSTAQGGRSEASRRAAEPPRTIATLPQGVS